MSLDPQRSPLSIQQLLDIERVCDAFEEDCRQNNRQPIDHYLQRVDSAIRDSLQAELLKLTHEHGTLAGPRRERTFHNPSSSVGGASLQKAATLRGDRFELHAMLGTGGAATVWQAYDRQLERWVALKAPHADLEFDSERFLRESQVVAKLQHPRIVRVLDFGKDQHGYFMISELIEGETLADRMKRGAYSDSEIALLLAEVCDALAYAHDMGVVHRDLKPGNLLLNAQGVPFIADFGIAHHWKQFASEQRASQGLFGTPAYMAPEQVSGEADSVEPRTDIYAMGVILYQLLTGELPFRGSIESILQQITSHEPVAPRTLRSTIPIELETLCLKCLEKNPNRRVSSAKLLGAELRRFANHEPILSRPIGIVGRLTKLARKHPGPSSLVALVFGLTLLVAATLGVAVWMVTSSWNREVELRVEAERAQLAAEGAARAEREARQAAIEALSQAESQKQRAQEEAELSRESLEFLESVFQASDPVTWVLGSQLPAVRRPPQVTELLDTAAERAKLEFADRPRIQARLLDTIAMGYRGIGRYADAIHLLEVARAAREQDASSGDPLVRTETLRNEFYRGLIHQDLGEPALAQPIYQRVLDELKQHGNEHELFQAEIEFQLGWLLVAARDNEKAIAHFDRSLAIRTRLCPPNSAIVRATQIGHEIAAGSSASELPVDDLLRFMEGNDQVSEIASNYVLMLGERQTRDYDAAIERYEAILEQIQTLTSDEHPIYLLALGDYAQLLWLKGDFKRALPCVERLLTIGESLAPTHPKLHQARLLFALELMRASRFSEARRQYEKMLERDVSIGQFSWSVHEGLAWLDLMDGEFEKARFHAQQMIDHSDSNYKRAWGTFALGLIQEKQGERESTETIQRAVELAHGASDLPEQSLWLERMAGIFQKVGDYAECEKLLRRSLEVDRKVFPAQHPHVADRLSGYAGALAKLGKTREAATYWNQAIEIYRETLPPDDQRISRVEGFLAEVESSSSSDSGN